MVADPSFWKGRRVLLTGHTGFKGSWAALRLHRLGARVSGFALDPPSTPSLFHAARIDELVPRVGGDVRDLAAVIEAVRSTQPEVVVHMAAQSLVRPSYSAPVETFATNVMGTVHVLEAVRVVGGVRAFVNVTSDKCYENREWVWGYRENEPMGGHDPYSASKGCAELVTAAFRRSYFSTDAPDGVAVASVRAGNVIGGGDWATDRLVPDAIGAFARGEKVRLRNPDATRPWQHVIEPVDGYLQLAERLVGDRSRHAGAWNFGPREDGSHSVGHVVSELARLWGRGAGWELEGGAQPHEARSLRLDCSKARTELGWQGRLDLSSTLAWVVEWYDAFHRGEDARSLCERDFMRYDALSTPSTTAPRAASSLDPVKIGLSR